MTILRESVRAQVAFSVWALCQDGLPAPPFDRHGQGDARLRHMGLRADGWWRWLRALVAAQLRLADLVEAELVLHRPAIPGALRRAGRAAADPIRFAPPASRGVLSNELPAFMKIAKTWRREVSPGLLSLLPAADHRGLVALMATEIDPVDLFVVPYPETVVAVVAPLAFVIGIPRATPGTARIASLEIRSLMVSRQDADGQVHRNG